MAPSSMPCSRSVTTVVSFYFIIFLDLELEVSVILHMTVTNYLHVT